VKIKLYLVVYISTDNCTYHDAIYMDTCRSREEAEALTRRGPDPEENYEIREVFVTDPEVCL
jgi:hypothetical protein